MISRVPRKILTMVRRSIWLQGLVLAFIVVVPFGAFVIHDGRTLLNANALYSCCGFGSDNTRWTAGTTELSDTVDFIYPNELYTADSYKGGSVTFWNPFAGGGIDYSSDSQSAIFSPSKLFFLIVGPLAAQTIGVLSSMFCLILFTYLLLKKIGLHWLAATLGALGYISVPWLLFWAEWNTIVWIMAAWPLLLFLLYNRKVSGVKWQRARLMLVALVLGLQFYFGHLQFSLFSVGIVTLWFLIEFITNHQKKSTFISWLIVVTTALLIGSVSLVNSFAMLSQGHRSVSSHSTTYLEGLVDSDAKPLVTLNQVSTDHAFYVQNATLLEVTRLIIAAAIIYLLVRAARRQLRPKQPPHFVILMFALTVIGFGFAWSLPGFYQLITLVPIARGLTYHYFIAVAVMAVPLLAAFLFDRWLIQKVAKKMNWLGLHSFASIGVSILAVVSSIILACTFVLHHTTVAISWLACAPLILASITKNAPARIRLITSISAVLILLISLWVYLYAYLPAPAKQSFQVGSPIMQCVANDASGHNIRFPRVLSVLPPNSHYYYRLSTLNVYDPFYPQSTEDFNDALNYPLKQRPTYGDNALISVNFDKSNWNQALGINYQIRYREEAPPSGYEKICGDDRYVAYRSSTQNSIIYSASQTTSLTDRQQLNMVRAGSLGAGEVLQSKLPTRDYIPGRISEEEIGGNSITFVSNASTSQLVFIGQSFDEGWTARTNGTPVSIIKANYKFMAVEIPAGTQHVSLTFTPKRFVISLWGVGVGVAATLAYGALDMIRKRQN